MTGGGINGPTVDHGKTPVEFRGLCLRLSATALEKKKKGKERPGPLPLIQLSLLVHPLDCL